MMEDSGEYVDKVQIKITVKLRSGNSIEQLIDVPTDDQALFIQYGVFVTRSATYMREGHLSGPLQA